MEIQKTNEPAKKVNRISVIVYYGLACAISWPFFWWRDMHPDSWQHWGIPNFIKTWSYMWGPGIAAIICLFVFKKTHTRTITFFGSSVYRSLIFYFVPLLALAIPGIKGMDGMNPHVAPIVLALFGFMSILGEELGWRGFLQDALRPLPPVKRYLLMGILWELWHFTNRMGHGELLQIITRVAIFMIICIILSFIIGTATDKSKSLMVAVTLHAWIDLLAEVNNMWAYIIFGLAIPLWIYLLWTWDRKKSAEQINEPA